MIEAIKNVTEAVVKGYNPEKIILFGSYAREGDADEESDLDLLIIKGTEDRFWSRLSEVRRIITGMHRAIPLDILVMMPEEVRRRLTRGDQVLEEVVDKGRVLYERAG